MPEAKLYGEAVGLPLPLAGETRLYAIIGDPVAQVGSPGFFNAAFRALGAKAVLIPVHVGADGLPDLLRGLRAVRNLDGIVVTIPHKIEVARFLDRVAPNGRRVGAVNAIRVEKDGSWIGDNFDGVGCVRGLEKAGHRLAGRSALAVGAGGAGRAVTHAFADAGIARMRVWDIDHERREELAGHLRTHHPALAVETGPPEPEGFDVVVNCTPLGMGEADPFPIDPSRITPGSLVVDVILKPPISPLLKAAEARGCPTQAGRAMLEGQVEAVLGFFGFAVPPPAQNNR
jgi:shikimate dehydrogenase